MHDLSNYSSFRQKKADKRNAAVQKDPDRDTPVPLCLEISLWGSEGGGSKLARKPK